MNLKITGLNFDVTEAVREHVALKLERISRHAGNLISVTVTLSLDKPDHKAEADAHLSGKNLHVEAVESENMYAAIDVMMDKLDRALIKHKRKKATTCAARANPPPKKPSWRKTRKNKP